MIQRCLQNGVTKLDIRANDNHDIKLDMSPSSQYTQIVMKRQIKTHYDYPHHALIFSVNLIRGNIYCKKIAPDHSSSDLR